MARTNAHTGVLGVLSVFEVHVPNRFCGGEGEPGSGDEGRDGETEVISVVPRGQG